jgi:serine/threonine protein kinase
MEQVKKLAVLKLERRFLESDIDTLLVEVPTFDIRELTIGKRLGSGCYSNVDEVRGIHLLQDQDSIQPRRRDSIAPNNKESKKFIAEHCIRESGDSRYALKKVRTDILRSNLQTAVEGLSDIAVEARFLASLNQHPNVIKLRGMASASHGTPDFFLLLDRLYDTLEQRITKMAAKKKRIMRSLHWGGFNFSSCLPGRRQQKRVEYLELYEDLIGYGYDIAAALDYCHKNKVIHRDCKPMNIGAYTLHSHTLSFFDLP